MIFYFVGALVSLLLDYGLNSHEGGCEMALKDAFGRVMTKLRVSVTDRCDLRCTYCMPAAGLEWLPKPDILGFEEIAELVDVAATLGIRKIRLTGGEPLVRKSVTKLVAMLASLPHDLDVAMTTNGLQLPRYAEELAAAGLRSVNVSLDTLQRERFHQLTRRDALARVMEGLRVAVRVFPGQVKVNCVALRGVTEEEYEGFVGLAQELDLMIRFIEFMPLDADASWKVADVLSGEEVLEGLREYASIEAEPFSGPSSPAKEYRFASGRGGVGFINSVTQPFCATCDRIRVTADGRLRTCLFSMGETDLRPFLRGGGRKKLEEALLGAVWQKEAGHKINDADFERSTRSMSQIGG